MKLSNILEIKDLTIQYRADKRIVEAVNGLNLTLEKGESLGLVGETGAGKTTTALGIMGLIPNPPGIVTSGEIIFEGQDLLKMSSHQIRQIRGKKISMIFQ
ncbi:MAG: ATP-binding cassette domain-containing protein, partial [Oscillospiraceae bacterium]